MGLAIAILLTLAMLGSVMWVMPSPREKQLTAMRQKAMGQGIKVRLLDQKQAANLYPWVDNHRGFVTYELSLPAGQKWPIKSAMVVPVDQSALHELDRQHELTQAVSEQGCFDDLPDTAEAMVFYAGCVGLLWREDSGDEGVDKVYKALGTARELDLTEEVLNSIS